MNMKISILTFFSYLLLFTSCDNSRNIGKDDICDKTFLSDEFVSYIGVSVTRTTSPKLVFFTNVRTELLTGERALVKLQMERNWKWS